MKQLNIRKAQKIFSSSFLNTLCILISLLFFTGCAIEEIENAPASIDLQKGLPANCNTIAIKANNNKYIRLENGNNTLISNRTTIGPWEKFTIINRGSNKIALRGNNGRYLSSENGRKPMTCNRTAIGIWEVFEVIDRGGNKIALKGNNGKYVSSENGRKAMTCNRTAIDIWEVFDTTPQCNGNDNPPPPNGGNTPNGILGLRNWKLNGLKGSKSNNTYVDKIPNLSSYTNPDWFFTQNNWVKFQVWAGSDTSSGSGNPRMELRELTANGNNNIFWDGTTNKEHKMKWRVRVDRLPSSGKVCFGQIHDKTDFFDDVIRVQCQGRANQTNGSVKLRINGFVTEELEGGGKTVGEFNLGQEKYYELTYQNSIVKLYELNNSGNRIKTIFTSKRASAKQNYFKAGAYLQSMKGKSYKNSDYGSVAINKLQVFH